MKKDENLFLCRQIGSLDEQLAFENADNRHIELKKFSDRLTNGFTVASPKNSKRLIQHPTHAFDHKFGIHVIGRVIRGNVDCTALAAKFVNRLQYSCDVNCVMSRLDRVCRRIIL